MSIEMTNSDIIPPTSEGETKMLQIEIKCPNTKCGCITTMHYNLQTYRLKPFSIKGILRCGECGHERPLIMDGESITEISADLPGHQSDNLNPKIAEDIKEDIEEAERALFNQCYKASVTMCRRALQLSLIDKGIEDKRLSAMLNEAKVKEMFTDTTFALANFVKGFGDIGAHRRELVTLDDVKITIYTTVKMLNELVEYSINK